ncbi:serine hydrolase [Streptomyces virginiae]|uniref:D-alanyl-D-alanine carboxypeptidase family protein n=1 Tax=Streptomyces virginiae TaxID=1961 RepID=UPI00225B8DB1|nr:serine hydrolase [Streptomyces virginiae]MCX4721722.1 serine hydrolase [Streptomyces virginiae]
MKAVTVAGGSSDDPKIEAETTVLEGEPEATTDADADAGVAGTDRAEHAPAEPEAEAVPETEPEVAVRPAKDDEPEAEAAPQAEPKERADTTPAAEAKDTARPEDDDQPEAEAEGEPEAETEDESGTEHAGEARPETDAEAGPVVAARPAKDDEPEAEAAPQAEPKEQAGTTPAAEAKDTARPEDDDQPEAEAEGEPEAEAETQDESEAELPGEARPESDTEPESTTDRDGDGGPVAADQADAASEPEAPGGGASEAEPVVEAPSDRTMLITRPKPKATEPDADAEAEPADEAPSDQTMLITRPKPKATEAEAEPAVEAPSDQTMLITRPKPKATEPEAPRKAPSWARKAEPDADADPERTSQFVALKDVDLPAPVAPRAQPPEARVAAPPAPAAPLPPLELLADLTNTPPLAETPRRTAVRRVKIWTPILLLLVGAGAGAQLLRPLPAPQLVAAETDRTIGGQFSVPWPAKGQGAVRVSGSGDIGTFGEQKPVPTASVAKVMTAYVILKGHPLRKADPGPDITIDAKTVADGNSDHESRVEGLTVGQKFSQQDVLKMLMIPSGNNAARLLARWDTGTDSEAAFVAKMNAAAKELGMTNTTYTDPSGLDSGTVSTAVDQLKLAEAVMKDEVFRSIVALPNASIKGLSTRLENNNILLTSQGLSIRGIKTGSSTPAGGALMWAAYKSIDGKDQLILGTLMDQHVDGPDEDGGNSLKLVLANSKTIIEGVRTALASAPVIRKGDVVGHVDDGLGGRTPLVATKDLNVIGVPGQQLKLSLKAGSGAGAGPLPHTAKAGAEVAVLTVGSGEGARSVPVAVEDALVEPGFGTRLTRGR